MVGRAPIFLSMTIWLLNYVTIIHAYHDIPSQAHHFSAKHYREKTRKMQLDKVTFAQPHTTFRPPSPNLPPSPSILTAALSKSTPSKSSTLVSIK